jgi:hypothetical protein
MHKNVPVVDMEILSDTGRIVRLHNLMAQEHLPLGVMQKSGMSRKVMDEWWTGRSIPASRDGIKEALATLDETSTSLLVTKCYGLSLSDQYWICPKGSGLKWHDVNFFENDFSRDMGEILFGYDPPDLAHISMMSPDNTSDGWLKKKWIIADGKRILMKGGSGVYGQEPFNEVIASNLMSRLGIDHVDYTLTWADGKPYSLCENFVTSDTELIPAWRIKELFKKDNRDSDYAHLLRCSDELGIAGVKEALDRMLALDFIIANEDRHYNNFGFIRNALSLDWIGFAPIYDSGTSLWYNTRYVGTVVESKPFKKNSDAQMKLVEDLSWFDYSALDGLADECREILTKADAVDDERQEAITEAIVRRAERINEQKQELSKSSVISKIHESRKQPAVPAQKPKTHTKLL